LFKQNIYICFLNNAGLFEPKFGSNMDKPKCWVKNAMQMKVKVEVGLKFEITCLTQHLSLSIFYPNLGSNNPA